MSLEGVGEPNERVYIKSRLELCFLLIGKIGERRLFLLSKNMCGQSISKKFISSIFGEI